jgi:AcrR family transcriptional regulator
MYKNSERHKRSHAERTAETRAALTAAARRLFAAPGYHATATEDLVQAAGVTRGALYYHFEDKRALFRAVAEQLEDELDQRVREAASGGSDIWDGIAKGVDAFLEACSQPDVKQILLVDGPSVLGWQEWHELDARHARAQIEQSFHALTAAGFTLPTAISPLAYLLHGALLAAALYLASAEDTRVAREKRAEVGRVIQQLYRGLVQPPEPSARPEE